jgi:2-methylcitrate dehydratase PrpD
MDANTSLFDEAQTGVLACLFQQPLLANFDALGRTWEIEGNTFKPYAACQLTHAAYEAGRKLAQEFRRPGLREIRVYVNPLAPKVASRQAASTPMEGKFCIGHCVALGLHGLRADISGFTEARIADPQLRELIAITRVIPSEDVQRWAARIELDYGEDAVVRGQTEAVRGSPGRPLTWADLEEKFLSLTTPLLQDDAATLLQALRAFEEPGRMAQVWDIIGKARLLADALAAQHDTGE